MQITQTGLDGLLVLKPNVIEDHRGFFMESYNKKTLKEHEINHEFVQDNHSKSTYGVLRGLHFQNPPYAQTKLVRVIKGEILDVVVDIRKSSSTYGQSYSIKLSGRNKKQILVPRGFAHGFVVLSDIAEIIYKCDNYYNNANEGGLMYNDPAFEINWVVDNSDIILSEKDQEYPPFASFKSQFE